MAHAPSEQSLQRQEAIGRACAAWVCSTIWAAMLSRTCLSSFAEGRVVSGGLARAWRFRTTWTGVKISPQGKPHQPSTAEKAGCQVRSTRSRCAVPPGVTTTRLSNGAKLRLGEHLVGR